MKADEVSPLSLFITYTSNALVFVFYLSLFCLSLYFLTVICVISEKRYFEMSELSKTIEDNSRMVPGAYKKVLNMWKNREYKLKFFYSLMQYEK